MRARKAAEEHERESLEAARQPARGAARADAPRHRGRDPARDPGDPQRGRRPDRAGDREGDAQGARRRGPAAAWSQEALGELDFSALSGEQDGGGEVALGGDRTGLLALAVRGREGARQARPRSSDELAAFADALEQNRELAVFFFSPYFSTEEKKEGLRARGRGRGPDARELPRAADREPPHAGHLPRAARSSRCSGTRRTGGCRSRSRARSSSTRRSSTSSGGGSASRPARTWSCTSNVDPDILGGIVLRVGNSILDASIRHRLEQLRREVAKAT